MGDRRLTQLVAARYKIVVCLVCRDVGGWVGDWVVEQVGGYEWVVDKRVCGSQMV
jgi:hypothetical protein